MTNPRITPAGISALAALIHEGRPDWDRRGIAAVLHKLADTVPIFDLTIAAARAACDPANDTPEAFAHLNNRAWDSDWYVPCQAHPETRARHTPSGECAACRSDRLGTTEPLPLRRQGVPPSPEVREQLVNAITQRAATADGATEPAEEPPRRP